MSVALTLYSVTFLILIPIAISSAIGTDKIAQNTELCIGASLLCILSLIVLIRYAFLVIGEEQYNE